MSCLPPCAQSFVLPSVSLGSVSLLLFSSSLPALHTSSNSYCYSCPFIQSQSSKSYLTGMLWDGLTLTPSWDNYPVSDLSSHIRVVWYAVTFFWHRCCRERTRQRITYSICNRDLHMDKQWEGLGWKSISLVLNELRYLCWLCKCTMSGLCSWIKVNTQVMPPSHVLSRCC